MEGITRCNTTVIRRAQPARAKHSVSVASPLSWQRVWTIFVTSIVILGTGMAVARGYELVTVLSEFGSSSSRQVSDHDTGMAPRLQIGK